MKYPLTFYTQWGLKDWQAGRMRVFLLPVILIRPEYREDQGLYRHELEHVKQWFATLGLHIMLYKRSSRYRLWAEVRAYGEQMRWPDRHGGKLESLAAAYRLALPQYALGLTLEQARQQIEKNTQKEVI